MNDIVVFGHPSLTSKSENIINIDDNDQQSEEEFPPGEQEGEDGCCR